MAVLNKVRGTLALKCLYGQKELAKKVVGARWNPKAKTWDYPLDIEVVENLERIFPDLEIAPEVRKHVKVLEEEQIKRLEYKEQEDVNLEVGFGHKLRNYQRVGAGFLAEVGSCILADDMGTGKTLQTITACEELGAKRVLVVCPNSLKWNWFEEVAKWTNSKATVVEGTKPKRIQIIKDFETKYLIINYEAVRLHEELVKGNWDVLVLDEAHKIKNRKAQQTKAIKKIKAKNVYLLSGTPMLNRPDELWSLLNKIDPRTFSSYWRFAERYCIIMDNGWGKEIKVGSPEQQRDLRQTLAPIMLRRTKKDVLKELPDKVHQRMLVELKGKQAKAYKDMEKNAIAKLSESEIVAAPVMIAQITRLRQIAISTQLVSEEVSESAKFAVMMELIKDNIDEHKIVIFSQFRKAIELFSKQLDAAGIRWVAVTGSVSQQDRHQATKDLQEDDGTRVMLATIEAAAHGLTWTSADIAIFLDRHWTPAINTQAEDRLHRMGQKNSVNIINLVARGTIEERIEALLEKKGNNFDSIINGKISSQEMRGLFSKS